MSHRRTPLALLALLCSCALVTQGCAMTPLAKRAAPLPTPASLSDAQRAELCTKHKITAYEPRFFGGGRWSVGGKKYNYNELGGSFLAFDSTREIMADFQKSQHRAFGWAVLTGAVAGAGVGYGVNELDAESPNKAVAGAAIGVGAVAVTAFIVYMVSRDDPRDGLQAAFNKEICAGADAKPQPKAASDAPKATPAAAPVAGAVAKGAAAAKAAGTAKEVVKTATATDAEGAGNGAKPAPTSPPKQ